MKETLTISHGMPTGATHDKIWLEFNLAAKDENASTSFANAMANFLGQLHLHQHLNVSAEGDAVCVKTSPFQLPNVTKHMLETVVKHVGHLKISESADVDANDILSHPDEPIFQELYQGFLASVDASLSDALKGVFSKQLQKEIPAGSAAMQILLSIFAGASVDAKLAYTAKSRKAMFSTLPGKLKWSFSDIVQISKQAAEKSPARVRGPLAEAGVKLLQLAGETLTAFQSVEVKNLPVGLQAVLSFHNFNPFAIMAAIIQEAGIADILQAPAEVPLLKRQLEPTEESEPTEEPDTLPSQPRELDLSTALESETVEEVEAAEQATQQSIEKLGMALQNQPTVLIPLRGSLQIGPSLRTLHTKMKETLTISHGMPTGATHDKIWLEFNLAAKDENASTSFANAMANFLGQLHLHQHLNVSAEGDAVCVKTSPFQLPNVTKHMLETVVKHVGHLKISESADVDANDILSHPDEPIFQELYQGFLASVDASLSDALKGVFSKQLQKEIPAGSAAMQILLSIFAGASVDAKLAYTAKSRKAMFSTLPGKLKWSFSDIVQISKQAAEKSPARVRGPLAEAGVKLLQLAGETLTAFQSVEVKNLPVGLQAVLSFHNFNPFAIMAAIIQEARIADILQASGASHGT